MKRLKYLIFKNKIKIIQTFKITKVKKTKIITVKMVKKVKVVNKSILITRVIKVTVMTWMKIILKYVSVKSTLTFLE